MWPFTEWDDNSQPTPTQQCSHPDGYTNWRGDAICNNCGANLGVSPCTLGIYK